MKTITLPQGKIIVDESAEIKDGYYLDGEDIYGPFEEGDILIDNKGKVIATINHSISLDVPMVVVEDEVEKQWLIFYKDWLMKNSGGKVLTAPDRMMFNAGYKAAQQKGVYTEEDFRGLSRYVRSVCRNPTDTASSGKLVDEYIQSLKQEYIELEMEKESTVGVTDNGRQRTFYGKEIIKTTRVDGQLMAYKKSMRYEKTN